MNFKNIIILEDSSKAKFGGGQNVTLSVAEVLIDEFNVFVLDCEKKSLFQEKIAFLDVHTGWILKCFGTIKGGNKQSFSIGILEMIFWPVALLQNIFIFIFFLKKYNLNRKDTLLYSPHKKTLILAYIINKLLGYKYVFHAHSLDKKSSIFYKLIVFPLINASKIICVSNTVQKNINLVNTKVIYNPIKTHSEQNLKNIEHKNKIIVAMFSTLIPLKGVEYFIDSYLYLSTKCTVEYRIYGHGYLFDRIGKNQNYGIL